MKYFQNIAEPIDQSINQTTVKIWEPFAIPTIETTKKSFLPTDKVAFGDWQIISLQYSLGYSIISIVHLLGFKKNVLFLIVSIISFFAIIKLQY